MSLLLIIPRPTTSRLTPSSSSSSILLSPLRTCPLPTPRYLHDCCCLQHATDGRQLEEEAAEGEEAEEEDAGGGGLTGIITHAHEEPQDRRVAIAAIISSLSGLFSLSLLSSLLFSKP
jgi:hypothetical protein